MRDVGRYRRNIAAATTRLNTEDLVLSTAGDLISQTKQIAIRASAILPGDPQREAALTELNRLREQFLYVANTRVGNEFIFRWRRNDGRAVQGRRQPWMNTSARIASAVGSSVDENPQDEPGIANAS